jgi:hypothetical protein
LVIPMKMVAWSGNSTCSSAGRGNCFKPRTFHVFFVLVLAVVFPFRRCSVVLLSYALVVSINPSMFIFVLLAGWWLC